MKSLVLWLCCIIILVLLLNPVLGDRFGRRLIIPTSSGRGTNFWDPQPAPIRDWGSHP